MTAKKKTWAEKMKPEAKHEIKITDKDFADMPAGHSFLIATPKIVDEYVRSIPKGSVTTIKQMREDLAAEYHTEYTCPVTSGIFLRIVAENAYEELQAGKDVDSIAPFWRIVDPKSPAAKKLACGIDFINEMKKAEGLAL